MYEEPKLPEWIVLLKDIIAESKKLENVKKDSLFAKKPKGIT